MFYLIIYLVFFTPFKFLMTLVILLIVISMIFRFWAFLYFCVSNEVACRLSFWGNFWTLVIIMRKVFMIFMRSVFRTDTAAARRILLRLISHKQTHTCISHPRRTNAFCLQISTETDKTTAGFLITLLIAVQSGDGFRAEYFSSPPFVLLIPQKRPPAVRSSFGSGEGTNCVNDSLWEGVYRSLLIYTTDQKFEIIMILSLLCSSRQ